MDSKQDGFALIEALAALIVLGIICFTGYYALNAYNNTNRAYKAANQDATSSPMHKFNTREGVSNAVLDNGQVSFNKPNLWSSAKPAGICQTDNPINCSDSIELSPSDAKKSQAGDAFGVGLAVIQVTDGKNAHDWLFEDYLQAVQGPDYTSVQSLTINGNQAVYARQTTSSYIDDAYAVRHGNLAAVVYSRVLSKSSGSNGIIQSENDLRYVPIIRQIANSITFK